MVFNKPTMRGARDTAIITETTIDAVASATEGEMLSMQKESVAATKTAILLSVSAITCADYEREVVQIVELNRICIE